MTKKCQKIEQKIGQKFDKKIGQKNWMKTWAKNRQKCDHTNSARQFIVIEIIKVEFRNIMNTWSQQQQLHKSFVNRLRM